MDSSRNSIAKLSGAANYQVWAIKMKSYLIAQDLWDTVDISPAKALTSDIRSQNSKALSLIILSCEDHVIRLIDPDDLAVTAWNKLKQQYGQIGFSARHLAFQSLVATQLSTCNSIDHFIDQFRSHITTLSQMTSQPLPQWLLLSILINNVSNQFDAWSQSIMQQVRTKVISEDSTRYLDEVIASLIDEARRTNHNSSTQSKVNPNTALLSQKSSKPKPICKHCGKIHRSENCWQMFPDKRPSARLSTSNTANTANTGHPPESTETIFSDQSSKSVAFLSQAHIKNIDTWIIDSGASQHMCNDKSQFIRLEDFTSKITIANNTTMCATGRGDVPIQTKAGTTFTLTNVLFVPQLASNLISVSCATSNPNIRLNFIHGECQIIHNGTVLATAYSHDSLLVLETVKPMACLSKSVPALTWHKRLGHLNKEYMNKFWMRSIIGPVGEYSCEGCLLNKSTRQISRTPMTKATRPLEKIHSDLAGPITPTSLGGNKYLITLTDDYSHYSWVLPCDAKSKFLELFKIFKRTVETEFGYKIAFLHCDNGGEYSSTELRQFAQQEGMQIQYTAPYSPEQNGVAERLNRTLFNTTRCFLNDSPNLIKPLWADLVRTACYIKNRVPTTATDNYKSPFEILYNRQPELDHLKIIGSTCYSHVTGRVQGKLEERSMEGILVGYEAHNIFRVFDPMTNRVFRARDVIVREERSSTMASSPTETNNSEIIFTNLNDNHRGPSRNDDAPATTTTDDSANIPNIIMSPSEQRYRSMPGYFRSSERVYTPDSTMDELADPRYDSPSRAARAFVSRCLVAADSGTLVIPETLEQAMSSRESLQWGESMRSEMKSLLENSTWELVPTPHDGSKVIQGRWVFQTKTDAHGNIARYKSRWVVKGFQQEEGSDFTDTFACVVKPMSYKILFSLAASLDLEIEQMDVKTAFLNSPIDEDVYVEQPHGFEMETLADEQNLASEIKQSTTSVPKRSCHYPRKYRHKGVLVCKLKRALYGLKQAPRAWYKTLKEFFHQCKLSPLRSDYAVFVNSDRTLLVAVYVDDILILGKNKPQIQHLKTQLHQRFRMTDLGPVHMYLGMQIIRDRANRTIRINQQKYIRVILQRFQMEDCNAVSTPMETGLKLCKRVDPATPNEIREYQRLIGCLEYAACATRPDITFAVHTLAQFASNPDPVHFNTAKRILRYLKGSQTFSLIFKGIASSPVTLYGYSDADWAASHSDRKSVGGYCFYLNGSLISHMSKKQRTIALSTAESETHAAMQATKEAMWLRNLLHELGFPQNQATTIYCDNQAAIALSRNPEFHSRSKHVDIQYHFLRHHVDAQTINLKFIRSEEMAADGLTKALSRYKHNRFCEFMQGNFTQ